MTTDLLWSQPTSLRHTSVWQQLTCEQALVALQTKDAGLETIMKLRYFHFTGGAERFVLQDAFGATKTLISPTQNYTLRVVQRSTALESDLAIIDWIADATHQPPCFNTTTCLDKLIALHKPLKSIANPLVDLQLFLLLGSRMVARLLVIDSTYYYETQETCGVRHTILRIWNEMQAVVNPELESFVAPDYYYATLQMVLEPWTSPTAMHLRAKEIAQFMRFVDSEHVAKYLQAGLIDRRMSQQMQQLHERATHALLAAIKHEG